MAYGKLKADSIIYDDSGSDVEKTIASLAAAAPTANPTFTGTVTIPTASANDNTTKAASTAYVQTELGDYLTTTLGAPKANPTFTGTVNAATITATGVVSDLKGDVRSIPQLSKSSAHTIVAADSGKHSINSSGGWVINTSTGFTAGQAITLLNNSGSDQTITATGVTLYNTADATTGNRTLASRGMATVICTASNTYYISGAGLS